MTLQKPHHPPPPTAKMTADLRPHHPTTDPSSVATNIRAVPIFNDSNLWDPRPDRRTFTTTQWLTKNRRLTDPRASARPSTPPSPPTAPPTAPPRPQPNPTTPRPIDLRHSTHGERSTAALSHSKRRRQPKTTQQLVEVIQIIEVHHDPALRPIAVRRRDSHARPQRFT